MTYEHFPDSGNIHSLSHDPDTKELHVRFGCKPCQKTGIVPGRGSDGEPDGNHCPDCKGTGYASTYLYSGIPVETVEKIRTSPSAGSALHQHVVKNIKGRKL